MTNNLNYIPQFFSEFRNLTPRFAILNREGQLLHMQSPCPEDYASLREAAVQTLQFFKLKDDDLILLNDPSCSGLGPGDLTWITACEGHYIIFRTSHPCTWGHSDKRGDEGIRIPPTPIRIDGNINSALLEILCSQGVVSCKYEKFKEVIDESIELSSMLVSRLRQGFKVHPEILDKEKQKKYFMASRKYFLKRIIDRIHGEARIELPLRTGEILKIKISHDENGVRVDLGGSTVAQKLSIPESWTQSAVISFIMAQFNETEIFNHGSFSTVNLIKPQQSFISAKGSFALSPTQKLATASIWSGMHLAFYELMPKSIPTLHDYFSTQIQWEIAGKLHDFILPSGSGVHKDKESSCSYFLNKKSFKELNTLLLSNSFDILSLHERKLSAQRSPTSGGPGWSLKLKAKNEMRISWATNNIKFPWKFSRMMSAITPGEVHVNNELKSEVIGTCVLKPNDEVLLLSGQGCGLI